MAKGKADSFNELVYNRTNFDENTTGDINNNLEGHYDITTYQDFNPLQQQWPTISPVISIENFIGWGYPGISRNCMSYAKAQIAKKGYEISNYFNNAGQTIQVYTSKDNVNNKNLAKGLSYLRYALENEIPVIVGVDVYDRSPNPLTDNTTDHFVVIVGMGEDNKGRYFRFYDNASGRKPYSLFGANPDNKLYYDSNTNKIQGYSHTSYGKTHIYTLAQIRKSKKK